MLLVTGITGHSGQYFLQQLINNNYDGPIRCIIRETSDTSQIDSSGLNIEKVFGDLNNTVFIGNVMKDVETIMHIYNIHHSPAIIKAAINNKVDRAILIHTTGIYSQFKNASEGYKNVEKEISMLTNSPNCPTSVTILRPSMIYGDLCDSNMSKFIKMVDKFRVMPVINGGNSLIQPVNARDLGKAFYKVLMSPNETINKAYDLTGDKPIKMIEVFRVINKELNKKTTYISVPVSMGVLMAKILKIISIQKIDYVERVQRMAEDRSYSHVNATQDFGFNPITFEQGMHIEIQEYILKNKNNQNK